MLHRLQLIFIAVLCGIFSASAQGVAVEAALDSTEMLFGEQTLLRTKVTCPKGAKVVFPLYKDTVMAEDVEVLDISKVDTVESDDGKSWQLLCNYLLTAFEVKTYKIPPFEVEVDGKKYASSHELKLKTLPIEVDTLDYTNIRPPKAPVEGTFTWSPTILLWSLVAWVFLFVFVFCGLRLAVSKPVTRRIRITPPTPPQKKAIAAIESLRDCEKEGEQQKQYYMELTDVLRTYLKERFGFDAMEMTTAEILDSLHHRGDVDAIDELRDILTLADLVKFSKFRGTLSDSDRSLLQAVEYIRTTQIDDPDAEKVIEKIVVVGDAGQRKVKMTYKVVMTLAALCGTASTAYVLYLLWLNFF